MCSIWRLVSQYLLLPLNGLNQILRMSTNPRKNSKIVDFWKRLTEFEIRRRNMYRYQAVYLKHQSFKKILWIIVRYSASQNTTHFIYEAYTTYINKYFISWNAWTLGASRIELSIASLNVLYEKNIFTGAHWTRWVVNSMVFWCLSLAKV